jgi:hypothetical protein
MQSHHAFRLGEPLCTEAGLGCQFDARDKPEFGLAVGVSDMYMHSRFFTRKEEQPKRAIADNCGRHAYLNAFPSCWLAGGGMLEKAERYFSR